VSCTACSSLCTVSVSLLTAARAEARFASRVAVLTFSFSLGFSSVASGSPAVRFAFVLCVVVELPSEAAGVVVLLLGESLAGVVVLAGVVAVGEVVVGVVVVLDGLPG
jgi:hypothetical protein